MIHRKFALACMLLVSLCVAGLAQTDGRTAVPLVVEKGVPLQVLLTEKLRFKENEPVHADVIEPVYSFDREVIPSGSHLEGTITALSKPGKWKRISAMLGGNFTPLHDPQIAFHTLVLPDGERIRIDTDVVPGTEKIVGTDKQYEGDLKKSFLSPTKKSPKDLLTNALWGLSPYRPQFAPVGTRLSAVLLQPLDFGVAVFQDGQLDAIGSEPPAGSVVTARLLTPLNSRTTLRGTPVEAELIRPLFSDDHRLLFPVGARLHGTVTEARPSRSLHKNGEMAFNLTTISAPDAWMAGRLNPQEVDGSLVSIGVSHDMKDLRIKGSNTAQIVESKKRFISPAWAFVKAERSLNATNDSFEQALLGAYRGKFLKQFAGGSESGFGLPGSISGAMIHPVGIGLGFFGAARAAYSNFLGRGRDIVLPDNTAMEIRLDKQPQATR